MKPTAVWQPPPSNLIDIMPNSFTVGDQNLIATGTVTTGGSALEIASLKDKKVSPLQLPGRGNKADGQISPDGKWLAYETDETGEWEVFIAPYPGTGGKLQVSRGGGKEPRWRGDGKEIFYLDPQGNIVAVSVNGEGTLATGAPTKLFQAHAAHRLFPTATSSTTMSRPTASASSSTAT